jgi:glutamate 5-kinase
MRAEIDHAKLLVVKIGSALLLEDETVNHKWLAAMAADLAAARATGKDIVIVTSGAVSLGCAALGLNRKGLSLAQTQAAAACGQIALLRGWQEALGAHGIETAQILLTAEDTEQRRRYLNARQTIRALLDIGAVPVINENDTVATQELRYGDNDRLAARVAAMISADCLLLLSDIDGLYSADPSSDTKARFIDRIEKITPAIEAMAGGSGSSHGSGGMVTKLQAAQIAQSAGCHMVLAGGRGLNPIKALAEGARSSLFVAHDTPLTARKNWIAHTLQPAGAITMDDGAVAALRAGKSLLPVGVTQIDGQFERGDCVSLVSRDGAEIGRGLAGLASADALLMMGRASGERDDVLGVLAERGRAELVHRDDMVLSETSADEAPRGEHDER